MESGEKFKLVLEKMILPHYEDIISVKVNVHGGFFDVYMYEVYYMFSVDNKPNKFVMKSILEKTISLFNMMGFAKGNDLNVLFVQKGE